MPVTGFAGARTMAVWVSDRGLAVYEGRGSGMGLPDVENWTLVPVADVQSVAVPAGENPSHMLLLTGGGEVYALGKNTSGQLGRGSLKDSALPDKVRVGSSCAGAGCVSVAVSVCVWLRVRLASRGARAHTFSAYGVAGQDEGQLA